MTFAAASCDFYDDGLVHAHDWARAIPPGAHHLESRRSSAPTRSGGENDDRSTFAARCAKS